MDIFSEHFLFLFLVWICVWLRCYYSEMCLSTVCHCCISCLSAVCNWCVSGTFTNLHFVIISSFKRSDIGCVKKAVYFFPTCDSNKANHYCIFYYIVTFSSSFLCIISSFVPYAIYANKGKYIFCWIDWCYSFIIVSTQCNLVNFLS